MSTDSPHQPSAYYNLKLNDSGTPVVDYSNSPGSGVRPYVNVPIAHSDNSSSLQSHSPMQGSPDKVRSPIRTEGDGTHLDVTLKSPLRRHCSETGSRTSKKAGEHRGDKSFHQEVSADSSSVSVEQAISNAKFDLLTQQGGMAGKGCEKCDELMDLLSSWQIGAGSLMRNYSRILSLLMRTRDSTLALECRLNEQSLGRPSSAPPNVHFPVAAMSGAGAGTAATRDDSGLTQNSRAPLMRGVFANGTSPKRAARNRQSMFVTTSGMAHASANVREHDLAENMYPKREELVQQPQTPPAIISAAVYSKSLEELKKNLWNAIDLCQQLAAACFKNTHLTKPGNPGTEAKGFLHSQSDSVLSHEESISLSSSTPSSGFMRKNSEGALTQNSQFKSSLQTISESKSGNRKRRKRGGMERVPSAPSLECSSEGMTSSGEKESSLSALEDGYVHVSAEGIPDSVTRVVKKTGKVQKEATTQNGVENQEAANEASWSNGTTEEPSTNRISLQTTGGTGSSDDAETESASDRGISPFSGDKDELSGGRSESMLSSVSTYTDSDVKYVMSKIASLEEERYGLMETIDKLHNENSTVRLSLHEILGDLGNKDLQLTLAMQDLSIATDEIRKATDMRKKLNSLSGERDALLERLGELEDESSAVKVSLIQLLQEKSATNKTLALENWRLTQKTPRKSSSSDLSAPAAPSSPTGGDNVSIRSGYSSTADDSAVQEAVMGADLIENFVHKQGFLVKQGGRVKSWRKRLFVLNTDGLSYYKTEQPIQTLAISKIEKVQVCHGRCPQPNMFEVHTHNRVFYMSASSADEMQSWVGMLETLKQYRRTATMHARLMNKAKVNSAPMHLKEISVSGFNSAAANHAASLPVSSAVALQYTSEDLAAGSYEDSEEDAEHITLHQQLPKTIPSKDDDDDVTYLIGLGTGTGLSVPVDSGMASRTRSLVSGKVIEGLDLSNL